METDSGIQVVHLQILSYLASCNRYSDTPTAVTEYLGVTKGTASQSLARLEEKGLISKRIDPGDGRKVRLAVTRSGADLLARSVPGEAFAASAALLSAGETERLAESLRTFLRGLQTAHGSRSFGICRSCRFHISEGRNRSRCGLTNEPLATAEISLTCREHEPVPIETPS